MPKIHTISVFPDGAMEYTRNPDLTEFFGGKGDMQRVTEISKMPYGNAYYIQWKLGPYAGQAHTRDFARTYLTPDEILETLPVLATPGTPTHVPLTFPTYEAAVAHEVQVLRAMRLAGVRFGTEA